MAGIFMDSGAFSAYTQKTTVDINKYIEFLHTNKHKLDVYCCLDVIGDAEATWKNFDIMKKAGLDPLPVFHVGEDFKYLHKCLEYEYFCLGGMATTILKNNRAAFLDKCFSIICDKEGYPKSKVHGLGMTDFELMLRYPFYSVDSTSWRIYAANGLVLIPARGKDDEYDYKKLPHAISFCNSLRNRANDHFESCSKDYQEFVLKYLESKNYTPKDMKEDNRARSFINVMYFMDFQDHLPEWPWKFNKSKVNFFH
jgi:hypothetical protein